MPAIVKVLPLRNAIIRRPGCAVVSTVSKGGEWSWLSPFLLGPCPLYSGFVSQNMENGWQFSKVYPAFVKSGKVLPSYWNWAEDGWNDSRAHRYPMGKGAIPLFSLWDGETLGYVEARKAIYGPLYAEAVTNHDNWDELLDLYHSAKELILLDYDAYDHRRLNMTLTEVINNPLRKMGHAFVLAMLLTQDPALKQMELR